MQIPVPPKEFGEGNKGEGEEANIGLLKEVMDRM